MEPYDSSKLYDKCQLFFELNGNAKMKLTPSSATMLAKVCNDKKIIVDYIEGGIYDERDRTFDASLDCIWSGFHPPYKYSKNEINDYAISFIRGESENYNAFVITTRVIGD
jgi:hypothetical protein